MMWNAELRRRWRLQLQRLIQAVPDIEFAILASGGGVVVACPSRPVLRIVGLAATTPEMLALLRSLHRVDEPLWNERLGGTLVRMRGGLLFTRSIENELALKLLFRPAASVDLRATEVSRAIKEIRAISSLAGESENYP